MQPMENKIVFDERSFQRIEKKEKDLGTVYHRSLWKDIVSEIKSNPVAIFAVIFLIIIIVASLLAPLSPYDPNKLDLANKFAAPSMQHPFGCDEYGRDYFTRALYGGRVSLMVGFAAMLVTVFIGTTIGIFSGYIGGKLDMLLMRFTDIFLALPSMLLMIVLNTILKPGMTTLILVLSLFSWASVARITRAETMSLKERDFVVASKNLGAGNVLIAVQHIQHPWTGHRCSQLGRCQCDSDRILPEFFRAGYLHPARFLGKYASGGTGAHSGQADFGNLPRTADPAHRTEL